MVWVRLDDHFDEHPKLAGLDDHALVLFIASLAYCNRMLTDGFIPLLVGSGQLRGARGPAIKQLERVGLWAKADGGWRVHDFGDYQPTAEAVAAQRESDRKRKRKDPGIRPESTPESGENPGLSPAGFRDAPYPVPVNSSPYQDLIPVGGGTGGTGYGPGASRGHAREVDPKLLEEHERRLALERKTHPIPQPTQ